MQGAWGLQQQPDQHCNTQPVSSQVHHQQQQQQQQATPSSSTESGTSSGSNGAAAGSRTASRKLSHGDRSSRQSPQVASRARSRWCCSAPGALALALLLAVTSLGGVNAVPSQCKTQPPVCPSRSEALARRPRFDAEPPHHVTLEAGGGHITTTPSSKLTGAPQTTQPLPRKERMFVADSSSSSSSAAGGAHARHLLEQRYTPQRVMPTAHQPQLSQRKQDQVFSQLASVLQGDPSSSIAVGAEQEGTETPAPTVAKVAQPQPSDTTSSSSSMLFLDNARLRVGLDTQRGGAISYVSSAVMPPEWANVNLVNTWDAGRLIQQSYYGCYDNTCWADRPWRWNPVQGGSWQNGPSKLLESSRGAGSVSVAAVPRNWGGQQLLDDVMMLTDTELHRNVAKVRFTMRYTGKVPHPDRHQEVPAVFVNRRLNVLALYTGSKPWSNDDLTFIMPGQVSEYYRPTERWAAYVDQASGFGLGVYSPVAEQLVAYRIGPENSTKRSDVSYMAPLVTANIQPDTEISYDAYIAVGRVDEMRGWFAEIAARVAPQNEAGSYKRPITSASTTAPVVGTDGTVAGRSAASVRVPSLLVAAKVPAADEDVDISLVAPPPAGIKLTPKPAPPKPANSPAVAKPSVKKQNEAGTRPSSAAPVATTPAAAPAEPQKGSSPPVVAAAAVAAAEGAKPKPSKDAPKTAQQLAPSSAAHNEAPKSTSATTTSSGSAQQPAAAAAAVVPAKATPAQAKPNAQAKPEVKPATKSAEVKPAQPEAKPVTKPVAKPEAKHPAAELQGDGPETPGRGLSRLQPADVAALTAQQQQQQQQQQQKPPHNSKVQQTAASSAEVHIASVANMRQAAPGWGTAATAVLAGVDDTDEFLVARGEGQPGDVEVQVVRHGFQHSMPAPVQEAHVHRVVRYEGSGSQAQEEETHLMAQHGGEESTEVAGDDGADEGHSHKKQHHHHHSHQDGENHHHHHHSSDADDAEADAAVKTTDDGSGEATDTGDDSDDEEPTSKRHKEHTHSGRHSRRIVRIRKRRAATSATKDGVVNALATPVLVPEQAVVDTDTEEKDGNTVQRLKTGSDSSTVQQQEHPAAGTTGGSSPEGEQETPQPHAVSGSTSKSDNSTATTPRASSTLQSTQHNTTTGATGGSDTQAQDQQQEPPQPSTDSTPTQAHLQAKLVSDTDDEGFAQELLQGEGAAGKEDRADLDSSDSRADNDGHSEDTWSLTPSKRPHSSSSSSAGRNKASRWQGWTKQWTKVLSNVVQALQGGDAAEGLAPNCHDRPGASLCV